MKSERTRLDKPRDALTIANRTAIRLRIRILPLSKDHLGEETGTSLFELNFS